MAEYIFTMQGVTKIVPPQKKILSNINLSFFPGAKIGVLGLNGSGKSSLLKIMAGVDAEYDGEARPMKNINIGYFPQEPVLDASKTVSEILDESFGDLDEIQAKLDKVYSDYSNPDADYEKLAEDQSKYEEILNTAKNSIDLKEIIANALRIPPMDQKIQNLSGGEKRRVALSKIILSSPDMLLLDEPTNHLDAESVHWLEQYLKKFKGTVVAVTHDRYFLDNVAEWILELDRGMGIPWKGNYSSWLDQKNKRLETEEKKEIARKKTIEKELAWVNSNAKGRRTKSRARISQFEELTSFDYQKRNETHEIFIPVADRLGKEVINAENLKKNFDNKILFENLSFSLPPGAIMGIVGPNGAGKTTLFKMLVKQLQPDEGTLTFGSTVNIGYVDQERSSMQNEKKTVWEAISNGLDIIKVGKFEIPSRSYIGRFNFRGSDQQKFVNNLSGGERGRLHLAASLINGSNVLLLDEPSNDLDVETLRALEDAILEFAGSVIVISHDRWFLDRICTHILAFEGDSKVIFFEGNYSEYESDKLQRLGDNEIKPKKLNFKFFS